MMKWIGGILVLLFGYALWRTHQAATTAPRCPTVGELEQINRDIYEGKTDLVTAENLATSYAAIPGCESAATSIRTVIAAKKAESASSSTSTSTALPSGGALPGLTLKTPEPWSKYSDAFTSDPSVTALDKIWRDRVLYYLEMDPRTIAAADLDAEKNLYATLQKDAGWVVEVLRRHIALADPSYGKAGDPQVFPGKPITPLFPLDTAATGVLLRRGEAA